VSSVFGSAVTSASGTIAQGGASMVRDVYGDANRVISSGMATGSAAADYFRDKIKGEA
jgi:hypothetical protein